MAEYKSRIKELRKKNGWSQKELAKNVGVKASAISMWENDKRRPDFNSLVSLANIFDISIDYLIGRERIEDDDAIFQQDLLDAFHSLNENGKQFILEQIAFLSNKEIFSLKNPSIEAKNIISAKSA